MSKTITLTGGVGTLTLNGYVFTDLIEGDAIELTPVNPKTSRVNANKGVTVNNRSDGDVYDCKIRVQKYSDDDIFLNSGLNQKTPVLYNGSHKENFQRDGVDGVGTWSLQLGSHTDRPSDIKNTQEGNAAIEYTLQFRIASRNF